MRNKFLLGMFCGLIIGLPLSLNMVEANTIDEKAVVSSLPQIIQPINLEGGFSFAGEAMPDNFDTRERIDRELSVNAYWHSATLLNIKSAYRYFPEIEKILAENGVPDDFKFLAVAESNLRNVTSSARAKGFWQFRQLAAKEFDLEVNDEVDERFHIEKSTRAACKYLKQLYKRFGSWSNAAAAYNIGPTNFSSILKSQGQDSFYDLNLTDETSRYVFRLIAIKEIIANPSKYGFYLDDFQKYKPLDDYYEVVVNESVDSWGDFAKKYNISYRMLKIYNPWLIDNKLTVIKNTYTIKIPRNV
jgi:hypothetical protein